MTQLEPRLISFVRRCDQTATALGLTRSTVSTKLFNDGKRLGQIAGGHSDIGVRRLALAEAALDRLMLSTAQAGGSETA